MTREYDGRTPYPVREPQAEEVGAAQPAAVLLDLLPGAFGYRAGLGVVPPWATAVSV